MGRITGRYFDVTNNRVHWSIKSNSTNDGLVATLQDAIDKLAHYEDMEEQGRLIELPCAVGDTVWCIYEKKIYKGTVTVIKPFVIEKGELLYVNINVSFEMEDPFYGDGRILAHEMYGRYLETVFLTKEEAERKLKEFEE